VTDADQVALGVTLVVATYIAILGWGVIRVGWWWAITRASLVAGIGAISLVAVSLIAAGTTPHSNATTCTKATSPTDG